MKKDIKQSSTRLLSLTLMLTLTTLLLYPATSYADDKQAQTNATVIFEAGEIELISAPALNFGSHKITGAKVSYAAEEIDKSIKISDLRGKGDGWQLNASLSIFHLGSMTGEETLNGAYITVTDPEIESVSTTTAPNGGTVTLVSGSDSMRIMTAESGAGMGIWDSFWTNTNTELTVLAGTAKSGTSIATIDWNLQFAP